MKGPYMDTYSHAAHAVYSCAVCTQYIWAQLIITLWPIIGKSGFTKSTGPSIWILPALRLKWPYRTIGPGAALRTHFVCTNVQDHHQLADGERYPPLRHLLAAGAAVAAAAQQQDELGVGALAVINCGGNTESVSRKL
jgi:hypothetical protein